MKTFHKIFIFTTLLLAIVASGVAFWAYRTANAFAQTPLATTPNQQLNIAQGTNSRHLAKLLQSEFHITNSHWLFWYLKLHPEYTHLKAGTYTVGDVKTVGELLHLLNSGKEVQLHVRLLEGTTFKQWRSILANAKELNDNVANLSDSALYQALQLPKNTGNQNLEGWFYPDTYSYTPSSNALDVLKRASQRLQKDLQTAWQQRAENLPLKTPYEMLILASIVEKETSLRAEQPKVASVFINRLRKKMKLQTDPTVIYGMGENYHGNLRRRDLTTPTPYNTYVIDGLPPTPIAMVSESALNAVAHPADTPYFYFVAKGDGGHTFSETLSEHNRAVRAYVRWYKQNIKGKQ